VEIIAWIEAPRRAEAIGTAGRIGRSLFPELAPDFLGQAVAMFDQAAVHHLMRVAGGLDSQVPGDVQVLGQVRSAYLQASGAGAIGPELHRLLQSTLRAGKRIHHETDLGKAGASIGRVAGRELFTRVAHLSHRPRIAVVGAGQTGAAAATELTRLGARVVILNRSIELGEALAARLGAVAAPFEARHTALAAADGAIIATGSTAPIITTKELGEERSAGQGHDTPLPIFDLSVPGNIEAEVSRLPGICLMTLEDLPQHSAGRQVTAANLIVRDEAARFQQWLRSRRARWAEVA
jgi:glutamyl-tRNA reductase